MNNFFLIKFLLGDARVTRNDMDLLYEQFKHSLEN
jgi:hypothetical protein